MQVYGNKDEMIHAFDINQLSKRLTNRIVIDEGLIHIEGRLDNNNKFRITYYYCSNNTLVSVLYVNELNNCKVLYYKDNEDVDNDEIDDAITEHIQKWLDLMEPQYENHDIFISSICYDEESKTNYMKNRIKIQLPDIFIDEDFVAKAVSHNAFDLAIKDPLV